MYHYPKISKYIYIICTYVIDLRDAAPSFPTPAYLDLESLFSIINDFILTWLWSFV